MNTEESLGAQMHDADAEARREAARAMGRARTERKIAAARAVAESRRGVLWTEEQKAKLREAQKERRERERLARLTAGEVEPDTAAEKRPVGRPRKQTTEEGTAPKRPVGRPKKVQAESNEGIA